MAHMISRERVRKRPRARLTLPSKGSIASAKSQVPPANVVFSGDAICAVDVVLTVTVNELLCPLARFSELGVMLQTAPLGAPEQVSVTVPVNPGDPAKDRL